MVEPGRAQRRRPMIPSPRTEIEVAAGRTGEHERRVELRRKVVQRVKHALTQRDDTERARLLAVGLLGAIGVDATDVQESPVTVNVAPFECERLLRPEPGSRDVVAGLKLLVSPALDPGTGLVFDGSQFATALRHNITLEVDRSAKFTSDQIALRVKARVDGAVGDVAGFCAIDAS
jgi:Phage capsid family